MNSGQEMFYNFFVERARDNQKEAAKELLIESFKKQIEGTFDRAYFELIRPNLMALVKEEHEAEVIEAMNHFGSRL